MRLETALYFLVATVFGLAALLSALLIKFAFGLHVYIGVVLTAIFLVAVYYFIHWTREGLKAYDKDERSDNEALG